MVYERELWRIVMSYEGVPLLGVGLASAVLSRPFSRLCCIDNYAYWKKDVDIEWRMRTHAYGSMVGKHNVELFPVPPSHRSLGYVPTPGRGQDLETSRLLSAPMPPVLAYYSDYTSRRVSCEMLVWRIAVAESVPSSVACFLACVQDGVGQLSGLGDDELALLSDSDVIAGFP